MLFNSYVFVCGFLPAVLLGFFLCGRAGRDAALLWLIGASAVFYAWWRPLNVLLMSPSILINFGLARLLLRMRDVRPGLARAVLLCGVAFNICFLGYFKYHNFFLDVAGDITGTHPVLTHVILPLGISFITFQKIAFLVDVQAGRIAAFTLRDYALFVLFFPQLVAGPIVHYREMMPQFHAARGWFNAEDLAVGISLFCAGLFKKAVLADGVAVYVSPIYAAAAAGGHPALLDGWIAALGYTLQIYFDFSGYTDMALGLARLFGIVLPPNFNSPLRATNIIDFWLRWHISLTRFLTAYIYNPLTLALTRRRLAQGRAVMGRKVTWPAFLWLLVLPTMLTMAVSGLWHGAGYTFVIWGLMHGAFLVINHAWRQVRPKAAWYGQVAGPGGFLLTFGAVVVAMVMFRADRPGTAWRIWQGMACVQGVALPQAVLAHAGGLQPVLAGIGVRADFGSGAVLFRSLAWILALLVIALACPNTMQILSTYRPALGVRPEPGGLRWRPDPAWALFIGVVAAAGFLSLGQLSEFLYWQF
jgi:D-alanyl-lipoteichoic acid acyltransferase DltB (MBOAT superfamily)